MAHVHVLYTCMGNSDAECMKESLRRLPCKNPSFFLLADTKQSAIAYPMVVCVRERRKR